MPSSKPPPSLDICAPKVNAARGKSCFTRAMLVRIAELYNKMHTNKINTALPERKLWAALQTRLSPQCGNNESCWLEMPFIKGENPSLHNKMEKQFKPKKPGTWDNNPTEWLNTNDINSVMNQYQESDASFRFVGVFPIDFAHQTSQGQCVSQEMCSLDLEKEWKAGKRRLGIIFNTDKSTGPGMHWISLYIGLDPKLKNYGVYFYDSVAAKPPAPLASYMKLIHKQLKALQKRKNRKSEYRVNCIRRQYKGYNCGVFAMVFQILMLRAGFDQVCKMMGYDDDVQKFRDTLYRRPSV
jgi:hypothetical protein